MLTWIVESAGQLKRVERDIPQPNDDELLVRVVASGVCRTDLHVRDGDLPVHKTGVVPGHEVVGTVEGVGTSVTIFAKGDRVGVPWLRHTCGVCRFCRRGAENLCPNSLYTGWDADGGYAEYVTVPAAYAYKLPDGYADQELAPLLCAGIIGFRALKRTGMNSDGRLGIYGFGGSAHLTLQVALARGARVHVMTRDVVAQRLALDLGAASATGAFDSPPEPLDAAILFAPIGELAPVALRALDRGGILSIAGIHLSDLPPLNYERDLFYEREVRSVTANTREDGREFFEFVRLHRVSVVTTRYALTDAARALDDLKAGRFAGAAVLVPD